MDRMRYLIAGLIAGLVVGGTATAIASPGGDQQFQKPERGVGLHCGDVTQSEVHCSVNVTGGLHGLHRYCIRYLVNDEWYAKGCLYTAAFYGRSRHLS